MITSSLPLADDGSGRLRRDEGVASPVSSRGTSRWQVIGAGSLIVVAAFGVYWKSLSVPFFFDDPVAILENPTIRHLAALGDVLSPPLDGSGVTGRPVVNLSLALNYAFGGTNVAGYHFVNILLHTLAGLALFGIVRRTLLSPLLRERFATSALFLAFVIAAAWTLHPLQTESVTCVIQRTELLVGLFYLLTLYCFIRGVEMPGEKLWPILTVGACLLGMASKEVMVSAPLLVLLYDRTFIGGSFATALRVRRGWYIALGSTWLLLGCLVISVGGTRGEAAGFGVGAPWWAYALKQCDAIVHYLRLSFWPHPLVVFYGVDLVTNPAQVWLQIIVLASLLAAVGFSLRRWPALGFLGLWFFALLAPSSSVIPLVSQTMAEHRMYLPLAAIVVFVTIGLFVYGERSGVVAAACLLGGLALVSARRNQDYRSPLSIWTDTVAKVPLNARAHSLLGEELRNTGRIEAAMAEFQEAFRIDPHSSEALNNIGTVLLDTGRPAEAIAPIEEALRIKPKLAVAHNNLGSALTQMGREAEGVAHFQTALNLRPDLAEAHSNLAGTLIHAGKIDLALAHSEAAIRAKPDLAIAHYNLAIALRQKNQTDRSILELETAVRLNPNDARASCDLGSMYYQKGQPEKAIPLYIAAVKIRPNYVEAHSNLGSALYQTGHPVEAVEHYQAAIRLQPDFPEAHCNLAIVLSQTGKPVEAIAEYEEALRLKPDYSVARDNLARLRATIPQTTRP